MWQFLSNYPFIIPDTCSFLKAVKRQKALRGGLKAGEGCFDGANQGLGNYILDKGAFSVYVLTNDANFLPRVKPKRDLLSSFLSSF